MNAKRDPRFSRAFILGLGALAAAVTLTACTEQRTTRTTERSSTVAAQTLSLPIAASTEAPNPSPAPVALPESAYACYDLGIRLWKGGELENAERALVRSAELSGEFLKTWVNLARVRMDRKDFEGALGAADAAIELNGDCVEALHQRGRALAALGRNDEAIAALESARERDPEHGYVANTLGLLLIQSGRFDEAVPLLEVAKGKLPNVAYVRNNLGVAYERTGEREKAVAEYRAAIELGDSGGKAAQSLARLAPVNGTGDVDAAATVKPDESVVAKGDEPKGEGGK